MKFKAVLFDIDGTLIPNKSVVRCLKDTIKSFGLKRMTMEQIQKQTMGFRLHETFPKIYPELKGRIEEFRKKYYDLYQKGYRKYARLFLSVKPVFKFVRKKKLKIGIVTTKGKKSALTILKGYKIDYDVAVTSDDVKYRKPHPEPLLKACKKLRLKPKECIFVGDHKFDMMSAKRAGCYGVGVLTGHSSRKELKSAGAKIIIRDLRGVKKLLE